MSFGYSRPHSTDSWRSRRPTFELSSRMHSIPRNPKSPTRNSGGTTNYSSAFVESPFYYMHRNDPSMSRESPSPRSTGRSYDRDVVIASPCTHPNCNQELARKMAFNLHEEADKPFLTITLEEICDPDRINDICLNTLTSMMKSKTYRKFLHHMNNNAIPATRGYHQASYNGTGNNLMETDTTRQNVQRKKGHMDGGYHRKSKEVTINDHIEVTSKSQSLDEFNDVATSMMPKQRDFYSKKIRQRIIDKGQANNEWRACRKISSAEPPKERSDDGRGSFSSGSVSGMGTLSSVSSKSTSTNSSKRNVIVGKRVPRVMDNKENFFEELKELTKLPLQEKRRQREAELFALSKLREKLPPLKQKSSKMKPVNLARTHSSHHSIYSDLDSKRRFSDFLGLSYSTLDYFTDNIFDSATTNNKQSFSSPKGFKKKSIFSKQIAELEKRIRDAGKEPGIHFFSKKLSIF